MRAIYLIYIIYLKSRSRGQGVGSGENFNENILTKFVLGGKGAGERGAPHICLSWIPFVGCLNFGQQISDSL